MPISYAISYIIMASATTVGAIRFKRLSNSSRWLLLLLILIFSRELLAYSIGHIYKSNLIIYHLFTPVQCAVFLMMYYVDLKTYRRLFYFLVGLVLISGLISLFIHRTRLTSSFPSMLQNEVDVVSVVVILLYLRKLITQPTIHPFGQYPLFWISLGWLLLIMLTSVGLSTFNYISTHIPAYARLFEQIRVVADFQLYTLFLVAFLSQQRSICQPNG